MQLMECMFMITRPSATELATNRACVHACSLAASEELCIGPEYKSP
jgi:hypothetical protein